MSSAAELVGVASLGTVCLSIGLWAGRASVRGVSAVPRRTRPKPKPSVDARAVVHVAGSAPTRCDEEQLCSRCGEGVTDNAGCPKPRWFPLGARVAVRTTRQACHDWHPTVRSSWVITSRGLDPLRERECAPLRVAE